MPALGLYLHVPFCSALCGYCNFNRGLFNAALKTRYVEAVRREIASAGDGARADSIFFGGGTPSLLEAVEVEALIGACRGVFDVADDAEITLEANPETLTLERLEGFRAAGVNRLSVGVQSFHDRELDRLDRVHTAGRAIDAVGLARAAGFDNLSLDLMMWLPQQTVSEWLQSVETLIGLGPEHASLYMLELYPNAPLRETMARQQWSLAPDDDAADMYTAAMERLEAAGLRQYEISNVSRPGRESRHNLKYWADGEWLGFGCGAHSTRGGVRWKNISSTEDYISKVSSGGRLDVERRVLSRDEHLEEHAFTGLRLSGGIDVRAVGERFGVDVWEEYGTELKPFVDQGLLIYDGARLALTRAGMLLANEILAVFIRATVR